MIGEVVYTGPTWTVHALIAFDARKATPTRKSISQSDAEGNLPSQLPAASGMLRNVKSGCQNAPLEYDELLSGIAMSIDPELQTKIDALEDERLKSEIIDVLTGPGKKRASDEAIYEAIVSGHISAAQQRAQRRKWRDDEVVAFAAHFREQKPEACAEFIQQEKDFSEIEATLAWDARRLILSLYPGLDESDVTDLFGKFRDHIESQLAASVKSNDREPALSENTEPDCHCSLRSEKKNADLREPYHAD